MWRGYLSMRDASKKWTKTWVEMNEEAIRVFIRNAAERNLIKGWTDISTINAVRDPEIQSYKQNCFELTRNDESLVFSAESEIQKDHFLASLEKYKQAPASVTVVPSVSKSAAVRGIRNTQSASVLPEPQHKFEPIPVPPLPMSDIPPVLSQPTPVPPSPKKEEISKRSPPLAKSTTIKRKAGTVGRARGFSQAIHAEREVPIYSSDPVQPTWKLKVGKDTTAGEILQQIATKLKTEPFMLILQDVESSSNKETALANHINMLEQMSTWTNENHRFVIQQITGISESLMSSPFFKNQNMSKPERRRTLSFFSKKTPPPSPTSPFHMESDVIKVSTLTRKPSVRSMSPKAVQKLTDEELNTPTPISPLLLFPGEVQKLDCVVYRITDSNQTPHWCYGTNFRLMLIKPDQPKEIAFSIPWTNISRTKKIGGKTDKLAYSLKIFCKNLLQLHLGFKRIRHERKKFLKNISELLPKMASQVFAYQFKPPFKNVKVDGWQLYAPLVDYARLGLPDSQWRVSEVNSEFRLSETYPRELIVPAEISDKELIKVSEFRSKGRIPVCVWKHPINTCVLMRAAQPMVGLVRSRSSVDEKLLSVSTNFQVEETPASPVTQLKNSGKVNLIIVDCRPKVNAQANALKGLGYEVSGHYDNLQLEFANIANIHVMRESLLKMSEEGIESSGWLDHIRKVLSCSSRISYLLNSDSTSVLIHCSDGWDRTGQISALSQIMLDANYRNIVGLCTIIEKEFNHFGHKVATRSGHEGVASLDPKDKEISPILLQFLDCVWQLTKQFPAAFEFDERLLLFIFDHLHSCLFGTFLCNSVKERIQAKVTTETISLWTFVLSFLDRFVNPMYEPTSDVLIPNIDLSSIRFWEECYHRWKDPSITGLEHLPPTNWS